MPSFLDRLSRAYSAFTGRETRNVAIPLEGTYQQLGIPQPSILDADASAAAGIGGPQGHRAAHERATLRLIGWSPSFAVVAYFTYGTIAARN